MFYSWRETVDVKQSWGPKVTLYVAFLQFNYKPSVNMGRLRPADQTKAGRSARPCVSRGHRHPRRREKQFGKVVRVTRQW